MKQQFILSHPQARQRARDAIAVAPDGHVVIIRETTRNLEQNSMLWALLTDIAEQVPWHGIKLSAVEYKDLLSASLVKSRVVPNMDGTGFVILGQRTSKLGKREFADLLELVMAFGTEHGVKWSNRESA
jgi:hypothetical protein